MNKYKKLLSNAVTIAIGTFSSKVLIFLLMPLYAACLLPKEYGTVDLITQTINLLVPVTTMGICNSVFRFAFDNKEKQTAIFSSGLLITMVGFGGFLLLTPLLVRIPIFTDNIVLIGCCLMAFCFHSLCAQFLRARQEIRIFAFKGIFCTVMTIVLNILFLAIFKMGIMGYLLACTLADTFTVLYIFFAARQYRYVDFSQVNFALLKPLLKYAIPLIPTTIFWWITNFSDHFLVTLFLGTGVNGLYAVAYKIPNILVMLTTIFMEAWQISIVAENNNKKIGVFFGNIFRSFQALLVIAASFLILFSKLLIRILTFNSAQYADAWKYMPFLIIATVCMGLVTFLSTIYMVKKRSVLSLISSLMGAEINIVLNIILIPKFGANGAAVATLASYFLVFYFNAFCSQMFFTFRLHMLRIHINLGLLTLQAICLIASFPFWILVEILLTIVVVLYNLKFVFYTLKKILHL